MILADEEGLIIAMAAMILSMTVAIVWTVAYHWRKARLAAYNARLKQLMIERGMPATEIRDVLEAGADLKDLECGGSKGWSK
jgi:hypothetical protein